jgi:predicted secreted acid phosphatase
MKILILIIVLILIPIIFNMISKFTGTDENSQIYKVAYDLGVNYINLIVKNKIINGTTPAVMFDIDDTLLFVPNKAGPLKPIQPIIDLLNYCRLHNFVIIIITARDSSWLKQTKDDLKKNNIYYDYLYLRQSPQDDYPTFKSQIKKMYMDHYDLTIFMSVGDNDIDIEGAYSGYSLKLPNKSDPRLFHINIYGQLENVVP